MKILQTLILALFAIPTMAIAGFNESKHRDKVYGAVIGAAVGDALGRVTEFLDTTDKIKQKYGPNGVQSFADLKNDLVDDMALYTDDTVMASRVMWNAPEGKLSLSEKHVTFTEKRLLQEICRSFVRGMSFDEYFKYRAHGNTNLKLHARLSPNYDDGKIDNFTIERCFNESNTFDTEYDPEVAKEGGCGSVMRAWPLGLVFYDDIVKLVSLADKQSLLTHRHPMARAASAAIAAGIAAAMNNKSVHKIVWDMITAAQAYEAAEKIYKRPDESSTARLICSAYLAALGDKTPEEVLGTHNKMTSHHRSTEGFLLGWAADEAVAAAVYIFARHPNDLDAAIIEGINTPGDSDSIATLAGALVGAYSGIKSLKMNYELLEGRKSLLQEADRLILTNREKYYKDNPTLLTRITPYAILGGFAFGLGVITVKTARWAYNLGFGN